MRAVLGHFCTGVAVVAGRDGRRPHGFACQSVTSVSLDTGAPALSGALATIEADVQFEYEASDHTIVLARVTKRHVHHDGRPLFFYRGGYGAFEGEGWPTSAAG